jgi:hypothetical protein
MARTTGIERVVYLGGRGDSRRSKHLRSRHETALALARHGPPLTYFRAGMVLGAQSESYRTLRYSCRRRPSPHRSARRSRWGPDVLSYGVMLDRMAAVLDLRRRPRVPVPFIAPWLSWLWIGLVTPVDAGVARPLVEGLAAPTVVTDASEAELFDVQPIGILDDALRRAVAEGPELRPRRRGRMSATRRPLSPLDGASPLTPSSQANPGGGSSRQAPVGRRAVGLPGSGARTSPPASFGKRATSRANAMVKPDWGRYEPLSSGAPPNPSSLPSGSR